MLAGSGWLSGERKQTKMPHLYRANEENGYTKAGTQRWRWTQGCRGSSVRNSQQAGKHAATFLLFYTWIISERSLNSLAQENNTTRQTLHARMKRCWLIRPNVDIDRNRVYDQLFIEGTYLNKQCLHIAASAVTLE